MRVGQRLQSRAGAVLAATALVATVLMGASAPGAGAQETTTSVAPPPLPVGVSLVNQSTWVALRHTFTMKLHLDNPTLAARPDAAIAVTVYQSTTSRSGFDDVVQGRNLGGTFYVNTIAVASLRPDAKRDVTLTFGLAGSDIRPTIGITRPGVYPVKVDLVNTGVASGSFVTWLVAVDTGSAKPIEKKLSVAFVWQVAADPIVLPDGTDDPNVVAQLEPGGRLDKIANVLGAASGFRYSVALSPETAVAWARLGRRDHRIASSFKYVRAAAIAPTTEVLPTTYVPIDVAALEGAGLGHYLPAEYAKGAAALQSALGVSPAATVQSAFVDPAPTSDAVVDDLRDMLIDRIAVREQALIPVTHQFSPAQAFVLDTTGGESRGVATAPFVETLFNGPGPSALRAERVVAALAEVAYETPSIARGIVIAPSARWNPDLPTITTVVSALRSLPLVQPATLDDMFASISNEQALGTNVQRRLVSAVPPPTPVDPTEYVTTATELSAYADVVGSQDPVVVKGSVTLLTMLSTSISAERAHAELAQIDGAVHAFTAGVTADEKRITLTSRKAAVPLTFENNLKPERDVKVRVHLDSAKLRFPNGADQYVTLKPGSNTIRFNVEARASGTFPMTISVTSPNGSLAFGPPVLVTVRSAVFGGWAVGLTVAALVFLAGWWANHLRRTRKNRRRVNAPAPVPTS